MPTNSLKTSVTVGSSDEADIIIVEPTVSRLHCRFDWNNTHWTLYDLNSTNGTFVNSRRIAGPTPLRAEDKVTLGRGVPCAVPQALSPTAVSQRTVARSASPATVAQKQKRSAPTLWTYAIPTLSLAALFLVIAFMAKGFGGASPQNTTQPAASKTDVETTADVPGSSTAAARQPGANQTQGSLPTAQSAMWLAMVESADRKNQKLLGTAIAVESKKLITLASLVYAADLVKDEYPQLRFINLANPQLSVSSPKIRLHPNYEKAMQAFTAMEKDLADKVKSVNSLEEPSLEEKLKWSERFETVMEAIANADLAIVETSTPIPDSLALAPGRSMQTEEVQECRLLGFPHISPCPQVNGNLKAYWLELQGQAKSMEFANRDYQVETVGVVAVSTISLACVDSENRLLGIVSRQATSEGNSLKKVSKVVPVRLFD